MFWFCLSCYILSQGTDKSFANFHAVVAKTASRQRGVCVEHLKRCKTSNLHVIRLSTVVQFLAWFYIWISAMVSNECQQGVAADHLGPLPTKTPIWSGDTDWDANLHTCFFHSVLQCSFPCAWHPAKPRTGKSVWFSSLFCTVVEIWFSIVNWRWTRCIRTIWFL